MFQKFSNEVKHLGKPFLTLFLIFIAFYIYTFFEPIPTDIIEPNSIGIGSDNLDIGDRVFYENNKLFNSNNQNIQGPFLYPLILKIITIFCNTLGFSSNSSFWNFVLILITTTLTLASLIFIKLAAWNLFDSKTAEIASWLFVICPYTIYFSLSGSLTIFILFGFSFIFYVYSKSLLFIDKGSTFNIPNSIYLISSISIYLSSLRHTTALFSFILILFTLIFVSFSKRVHTLANYRNIFRLKIILIIALVYALFQLHLSFEYILFSLNNVRIEGGNFFGVSRDLLRERTLLDFQSLGFLKNISYKILWKFSDFISGISDIRDTHSTLNSNDFSSPIFPFIARVFTGLFYIYPLNIISLMSIIKSRHIIFKRGLWMILISSLVTISPGLQGVAQSRYLFMFYPIVIIFSSKLIRDIFLKTKN